MSAGRALRGLLLDVLQMALRMFPWPTEPGLRQVGNPGADSPVIVTGNYDLTVRRVTRALRGKDAWLVVAPSAGINVWCAAAGGHLGTHQVVTALKTCGVEDRVAHRRAILPQLAATGVRAIEVSRRCHWRTHFGPVYAKDLPRYLESGEKKDDSQRHVRFGTSERMQMAVAWAAPISVLLVVGTLLLRPAWCLPLLALAWALALAVFLVYDRIPGPRRMVLGSAGVAGALAAVWLAEGGVAAFLGGASAGAALTFLLTLDYPGSTPIEGGSHFEERRWHIVLDPERCEGVFRCLEVCPEAVFEREEGTRTVTLPRSERCIRCGACVVQCPLDALAFEDEAGHRVEPETIRRFKLNLLGKRALDQGPPPPSV